MAINRLPVSNLGSDYYAPINVKPEGGGGGVGLPTGFWL